MIEYALLIMLGFCIGCLIAFLLAPTVWSRAVRLTTKRLEATMPMSLAEIEADKDLLRASYAIRIRRLEAGLSKARDKSANQLVDISKLQMQIAEMNTKIVSLNAQLEERTNAVNVFESTIRKRFPELENMAAVAKASLDERMAEISDLSHKLTRREEALAMVQRSTNLQQEEITRLREVLERSGSDTAGRFKRRPSQWTLNDYRSEYDRLNVELSKMREQLILAREKENRQTIILKTELQQLAERIMSSAQSSGSQRSSWRDENDGAEPNRNTARSQSAAPAPIYRAAQPVAPRSPAWRGERATTPASNSSSPKRDRRAEEIAPPAVASEPQSPARGSGHEGQRGTGKAALPSQPGPVEKKPDSATKTDTENEALKYQQKSQDELNALLKRSARFVDQSLEQPDQAEALTKLMDLSGNLPDAGREPPSNSSSQDHPPQQSVKSDSDPHQANDVPDAAGQVEPNLDHVFREIIAGHSESQATVSPVPSPETPDQASAPDAPSADAETTDNSETASKPGSETGNKTLRERLQVAQDLQTG